MIWPSIRFDMTFGYRTLKRLYRAHAGGGAGGGGRDLHFLKKKINKIKKYTFSNKRNLWWNTNVWIADLAEASKFMIGAFRSYIIRWAQERMRYLILSW